MNDQSNPTQLPLITPSPVLPTNTQLIPTTVPTKKPTPTSANIPTKYQLPDWINDSESTVALMISDIKGNLYKLSFLNLGTKDSFDFWISSDVISGYFWMPDGTHFGFLSSDTKSIFLIDTKSGNMEKYPITESVVRFLSDESHGFIDPLIAYGIFQKGDFYLIPSFHKEFSTDLKYLAKIKYESGVQPYVDEEYPFIVVENLITGDTTQITNPLDQLYDCQFSWSPTISYLEILQGSDEDCQFFSGNKIMIYKPDGEIVAYFNGNFTDSVWSPDGSKILYKETSSNSPCILEIETGAKKCIRQIERNHSSSNTIIDFKWSRAGDKIFYIYYAYLEIIKSGLCVYNLNNGDDFCPTIGLPGVETYNVEWYKVSPDEHFFVFGLGQSCYHCDYWGQPSTFVISLDGKISYSLGEEIQIDDYSYPMSSLVWRPNLSSKP